MSIKDKKVRFLPKLARFQYDSMDINGLGIQLDTNYSMKINSGFSGRLFRIVTCLITALFSVTNVAFSKSPQYELDARSLYNQTEIGVTGSVVQLNGQHISGATVSLQGQTTTTDTSGRFSFSGLIRNNDFLKVSMQGFHDEIIPVALRVARSIAEVNLPAIPLIADDANNKRFLFGGDTSFGRRFMDPSESTPPGQIPPDDPDAFIRASNPLPGSKSVVQYIRPYYQNVEYGVLNLESPVTDDPSTPHPNKDFKYFSLPGSLPALTWLGVDYVSLGNNHVYDYLDNGMADTLDHINAAGIANSGAGMNSTEAFGAYRTQVGPHRYALLSMTSITGDKYPDSYVAEGSAKGGAADLSENVDPNADVLGAIQREINAGFLPIVQLHGGTEYTYSPTNYMKSRFELAAEKNPAQIIAHHPHVAQGIGTTNDVVTVHSLGNLAFDQDRLDTMLGLLAQVDMRGSEIEQLRLLPVTIKDYRPRPLAGEQAMHFLRRIAEHSAGQGLFAFPYLNQVFVAESEREVKAKVRQVTLSVTIPPTGSLVLDLRQQKEAKESLSVIHSGAGSLDLQLGRDILIYGDFENHAVDDEDFDAPRWSTTPESASYVSSFISTANAMKGAAGLTSFRTANNTSISSIRFRNRVRVGGDARNEPLKDLSFFGYLKGVNAGISQFKIRYGASVGSNTFGEEIFLLTQGTHDWIAKEVVLNMPADSDDPEDRLNNPRAVDIWLRQHQPASGEGTVSFDELALVNWEKTVSPTEDMTLDPVNQYDFIKLTGSPGNHQLTLTFRFYKPKRSIKSATIIPIINLLLDED